MSSSPNNPFDFTGATKLDDVVGVKMRLARSKLESEEVSQDKIEDFFFDALEAPGVPESVRQEAVDLYDISISKQARQFIENFYKIGRNTEHLLQRLTMNDNSGKRRGEKTVFTSTFGYTQQAVRIVKLKDDAADIFLREIAGEIAALPEADRDEPICRLEAFIRAYKRVNNLPAVKASPFNFSGMQNITEISERATLVLQVLYTQGFSEERAVDLLYEALETLDGELKQQALDHYATTTGKLLKSLAVNFDKAAAYEPTAWDLMARARAAAQHAVHIARLKGTSTDRMTQEVASEMSALSAAQHQSLESMKTALDNAYNRVTPPPPKF